MDLLTSDDSNDSDYRLMKDQLTEFGMGNENLNKEEMSNLLKALNESKQECQQIKRPSESVCESLRRRSVSARDVRLPWSALPPAPGPAPELSVSQRARTLAAYRALLAAATHRHARLSLKMAEWSSPICVPAGGRSTRTSRAASRREPLISKRRRVDLTGE